jgi:tRNA A-37 threonylcarbamoyl transferase component Bud32
MLTDSFPLTFFGITQGSKLELEVLQQSKTRKKCFNSTYLDLIGLEPKYILAGSFVLNDLIECIKNGDSSLFIRLTQRVTLENPEENILNKSHPNLWGLLHFACFYGNLEVVRFLLCQRVNVNCTTLDYWTPLQLACFKEHAEIVWSLCKHKSIQINKSNKCRGTGLHLSCERNNLSIVQMLLESGAFVEIYDFQGFTPFDYTKNKEILDILAIYAGRECLKRAEEDKIEGMIAKLWFSRPFFIHDQQIILQLDTKNGYLRKSMIETFQSKGPPELSINLTDIQSIQEETNKFFLNKDEYYFVIETSKASYRFYDKNYEPIKEWVLRIEKAVNYFVIHPDQVIEQEAGPLQTDNSQLFNSTNQITESKLLLTDFKILTELGSGGFGIVYKAEVIQTKEIVALKILSRRKLMREKQLKYAISEIKIMKKLDHPFILPLLDCFDSKDSICLVLKYCQFGDLSELIRIKGRLDVKHASFILSEVILAIEYLHFRDIIYRDLKPQNVLIDSDGHARLADFGLAKEGIHGSELAKTFVGTRLYIAPEAFTCKGTSKPADIYGLGVLLYEMLTGYPPFEGSSLYDLENKVKNSQPVLPDYLNESAKEFIIATMNKHPEQRPNIHMLKHFPLFFKRDWDALYWKRIKAPQIVQTSFSMGPKGSAN